MKRAGLVLMAMVVAVWAATTMAQIRADVALRAAMEQETVKGDLKGAIAAYQKIVDGYPDNRAVQAQALVRMADCYQKLGDAQAKQHYERVIREFTDQPDAVRIAKAKLSPAPGAKALTIRRVHTNVAMIDAISSDGTKSLETDWDTGNVVVRDLATGRGRPITTQPAGTGADYEEFGEMAVFSRDGLHAAYTWCTMPASPTDTTRSTCDGHLRVVRTRDGEPDSPRVLYSAARWVRAYDWSPDGQQIAVLLTKADRSIQIAMISVADGSARVLKDLSQRNLSVRMMFSPDGKYLAFDVPAGREPSMGNDVFIIPSEGGAEWPVASEPAHELLTGWTPDGTGLLFTSDRGGTTDLYSIDVTDGQVRGRPSMIKADLGRVRPLGVSNSGAFYYSTQTGGGSQIRLSTVDFANGESAPASIPGLDTSAGTNQQPRWSRDGATLAYTSRGTDWRTTIVTRSLATGAAREIRPDLTAAFGPLAWGADANVIYTTGSDGRGQFGLYSVDLRTAATTLLSPYAIPQFGGGSLAVSADGRTARFFRTDEKRAVFEGRHDLIERDLTTGAERELLSYAGGPVDGSAVVSSDGAKVYYRLPDPGATRPMPLSRLVERDLASGAERELLRGRLGPVFLSPDGRHIAIARNDPAGKWRAVSLVSPAGVPSVRDLMRIDEDLGPARFRFGAWAPDSQSVVIINAMSEQTAGESWWVPIAGGQPRRMSQYVGAPALHPDGKRVAYQVWNGQPQRFELWVMEHFLSDTTSKNR